MIDFTRSLLRQFSVEAGSSARSLHAAHARPLALLVSPGLGNGFAGLPEIVILAALMGCTFLGTACVLPPPCRVFPDLRPPFGQARCRFRLGVQGRMELRSGAAVVDPRHL